MNGRTPENLPAVRRRPEVSRQALVRGALIATAAVYAGVLLLGPLAAIFWGALSSGLPAFVRELKSYDAASSFQLTLLIALGSVAVNTILGMCVAWVLVRDDFHGKRLLNGLVDLPFAVSPVIAGFMLILLFGAGGWFDPVLKRTGIKVVFAWPGILMATIFISFPFVVREVMPVLEQVSRDHEDAARTLGASSWQTFRRVTLPAIRWGLLYGISLTFARALGEIGAVLVVSGGVSRSTETSTLYILRSLDDRNYTGAYAMAIALAALSFVLLMAIEIVRKRAERL